jgi:hypothetical protein
VAVICKKLDIALQKREGLPSSVVGEYSSLVKLSGQGYFFSKQKTTKVGDYSKSGLHHIVN